MVFGIIFAVIAAFVVFFAGTGSWSDIKAKFSAYTLPENGIVIINIALGLLAGLLTIAISLNVSGWIMRLALVVGAILIMCIAAICIIRYIGNRRGLKERSLDKSAFILDYLEQRPSYELCVRVVMPKESGGGVVGFLKGLLEEPAGPVVVEGLEWAKEQLLPLADDFRHLIKRCGDVEDAIQNHRNLLKSYDELDKIERSALPVVDLQKYAENLLVDLIARLRSYDTVLKSPSSNDNPRMNLQGQINKSQELGIQQVELVVKTQQTVSELLRRIDKCFVDLVGLGTTDTEKVQEIIDALNTTVSQMNE
ncbi:MAG: hypothetical protein FWG65_12075 [Turicibacter sp.]|nr:hypothetical protein [Turicibacter sp.]